ncbi:hypothetical protein Clacol_009544 [Clathrus columnatus]|uniref:Protein-S-isoprenylcysteine O-methyltransferase n=1 Tax=Clathrus columnatus TaxID=1419009 RepID=A0AAV5ARF3_9AGAM|nr:hypothetical protein Clacol_009544 [Clathrus columnatus]
MTEFPVLNISLLLSTSIAQYLGGRPPNPPSRQVDVYGISKDNVVEKNLRGIILHLVMRGFPIVLMCLDIVVMVFANKIIRGFEVSNALCPAHQDTTALRYLSFWTLSGALMTCLGSSLRLRCYRELGSLFTIEVVIQPNHRLVTSGPYAYIRHPSYTGAGLLLFGCLITCINPTSYVVRCGLTSTSTIMPWVLLGWTMWTLFFCVYMRRRAKVEDGLLHKRFSDEWESYRQKVPCSFVPVKFDLKASQCIQADAPRRILVYACRICQYDEIGENIPKPQRLSTLIRVSALSEGDNLCHIVIIQASIPPTSHLSSLDASGEPYSSETDADLDFPQPSPAIELTVLLGVAPNEHLQTLHSSYASYVATLAWMLDESHGRQRVPVVVGIALRKVVKEEERFVFLEIMQKVKNLLAQRYNTG